MSIKHHCDRCGKVGDPTAGNGLPRAWSTLYLSADAYAREVNASLCDGCAYDASCWYRRSGRYSAVNAS